MGATWEVKRTWLLLPLPNIVIHHPHQVLLSLLHPHTFSLLFHYTQGGLSSNLENGSLAQGYVICNFPPLRKLKAELVIAMQIVMRIPFSRTSTEKAMQCAPIGCTIAIRQYGRVSGIYFSTQVRLG